jgi:hypothetical protein
MRSLLHFSNDLIGRKYHLVWALSVDGLGCIAIEAKQLKIFGRKVMFLEPAIERCAAFIAKLAPVLVPAAIHMINAQKMPI